MKFDTLMEFEQLGGGKKWTNYYLRVGDLHFKIANNVALKMVQQLSLERGQWMADISGGRKRFYIMG